MTITTITPTAADERFNSLAAALRDQLAATDRQIAAARALQDEARARLLTLYIRAEFPTAATLELWVDADEFGAAVRPAAIFDADANLLWDDEEEDAFYDDLRDITYGYEDDEDYRNGFVTTVELTD